MSVKSDDFMGVLKVQLLENASMEIESMKLCNS